MKPLFILLITSLSPLVLAIDIPAVQDGRWEITTKTTVEGMQMPMPAHTAKMCFTKDDVNSGDKTIPKGPAASGSHKCDTVEQNRSGNTIRYKIVCSGKEAMTISGEASYEKTSYQGKSQIESISGGQKMKIVTEYKAKRLGECGNAK